VLELGIDGEDNTKINLGQIG